MSLGLGAGQDDLSSRSIATFLVLTFLVTWGVVGFYILAPGTAASWFGPISGSHPAFFLATWSPAIVAISLVLSRFGLAGLRRFLSRVLIWRIQGGWAALVLVGVPLVYMAGSLLQGGPLLASLPPEGAAPVFAVLMMMLFLGPVEEFGWRGVLQPLLQRHMAPFWAGAVIGAIWGIWHLPAFFLSGVVFGGWNFLPFFVGNVVLGILVTPLLNRSGGGLFWPVFFHWQLINPFWPDARPWDTWILVALAAAIVWWDRAAMFGREGAVTTVLPARPAPSASHP